VNFCIVSLERISAHSHILWSQMAILCNYAAVVHILAVSSPCGGGWSSTIAAAVIFGSAHHVAEAGRQLAYSHILERNLAHKVGTGAWSSISGQQS
jgi:hypothetical protein